MTVIKLPFRHRPIGNLKILAEFLAIHSCAFPNFLDSFTAIHFKSPLTESLHVAYFHYTTSFQNTQRVNCNFFTTTALFPLCSRTVLLFCAFFIADDTANSIIEKPKTLSTYDSGIRKKQGVKQNPCFFDWGLGKHPQLFDFICTIDEFHLTIHISTDAGEVLVILRYINRCSYTGKHALNISADQVNKFLNTLFIELLEAVG